MTELVTVPKLGYDPVERWQQNSRSEASKQMRTAILERFLKFQNISPEGILLLARQTPPGEPQFKIEKMITDFLDSRLAIGVATSTAAKEGGVITGFLRINNVNTHISKNKYLMRSVYESQRILIQDEVRKMIKVTKGIEKQAVICVEAQAAQRIGILTALRFDMIHRYPQKGGKVYGIIDVNPEIANREGVIVNKTHMQYKFGLHWESMSLLDKIEEMREEKDRFVWNFDKRRMQRIITTAAKKAGVQKTIERKLNGAKWNEVHAHVFRRFWMARMDDAKITGDFNAKLLEYQLGHVIVFEGTYHAGMFTDEKIIAAMKQADKFLQVLP